MFAWTGLKWSLGPVPIMANTMGVQVPGMESRLGEVIRNDVEADIVALLATALLAAGLSGAFARRFLSLLPLLFSGPCRVSLGASPCRSHPPTFDKEHVVWYRYIHTILLAHL